MPHHSSQTFLNGGLILNFIATETNESDEYAGKIILCFISITFVPVESETCINLAIMISLKSINGQALTVDKLAHSFQPQSLGNIRARPFCSTDCSCGHIYAQSCTLPTLRPYNKIEMLFGVWESRTTEGWGEIAIFWFPCHFRALVSNSVPGGPQLCIVLLQP